MRKLRIVGLASILTLSVGLTACGSDSKEGETIGDGVDYKITGIEPGAGIMMATNKALKEYDNLKDYTLVESSSAAMAAELDDAIENEEPIIVTGWTPHWMFSKYDLKYLKDPKGVYGDAEKIETFTRIGLKDEQPSAYKVLDKFNWTNEDIGEVMVDIQEGTDPADAAEKWVKENSDKVSEWTKGTTKVNGENIKLSYVAWDSEIASTNVVAKVLENMGYKVELVQLDAGPMFTAVANGDADATVSGWLPLTHKDYLKQYGENLDRLGPNLEGAKTGLVVPAYVEAESIEDLK